MSRDYPVPLEKNTRSFVVVVVVWICFTPSKMSRVFRKDCGEITEREWTVQDAPVHSLEVFHWDSRWSFMSFRVAARRYLLLATVTCERCRRPHLWFPALRMSLCESESRKQASYLQPQSEKEVIPWLQSQLKSQVGKKCFVSFWYKAMTQ